MKKIFTKLIGVTLGLAMAVGVGVGVAANNRKATGLNAADGSVNKSSATLATEKGWTECSGSGDWSGAKFSNFDLDENINVSFSGSGNTATYWSSGDVRIYGTKNQVGGSVTFTGGDGVVIKTITLGFTLQNSATISPAITTGNAYTVNGSSQTFTMTSASGDKAKAGQIRITNFACEYTYTPSKTLASIALSGTYPTSFEQGDAFSHEGMTVTATYDDASTADVTASATFSGYNMSEAGSQTVTVSYTESGTTKTATYGINVAAATLYTVGGTITNGSLSNTNSVKQGNALSINIVPNEKYSLPESLGTVTMGGNTLTAGSGYTYNSGTGAFAIASVTGNVLINAECVKTHGYWADSPYTVSEAWDIVDGLNEAGGNTDYIAYVSGTISSDPTINNFDGADFDITDGVKSLVVYSVSGAKIVRNEEAGTYIENGYSVIVSGALIRFVKNETTKYEVGYKSAQLPGTLVSANAPTYTVTYNDNGATSGNVPVDEAQHAKYTSATVLGNTGLLAKTNYEFNGWNTHADPTANGAHHYNVGDEIEILANTTLYAEWLSTAPSITVTSELAGFTGQRIYDLEFTYGHISDGDLSKIEILPDPDNGVVTVNDFLAADNEGLVDISLNTVGQTYLSFQFDGDELARCHIIVSQSTVSITGLESFGEIDVAGTLNLGSQISVEAIGSYSNSVEWESSKPSVATVNSSGVVTGVAPGTTVITVTSVSDNNVSQSCKVTVREADLDFTWNLKNASYEAVSDENYVVWSSSYAVMANSSRTEDGASGTKASNYLGGDANSRTSSRMYTGNILTITPVAGYKISSIIFTATSDSYATALRGSTWTNAAASSNGSVVTVVPSNGFAQIKAIVGGTCGFNSVKVNYNKTESAFATMPSLSYGYNKLGENSYEFSNVIIRFRGIISEALWDELDGDSDNILGYGVLLSTDTVLNGAKLKDSVVNGTTIKDYRSSNSRPASLSAAQSVEINADSLTWNLRKVVSSSANYTTNYVAVAYIETRDNGIIYFDEVTASVKSLAKDMLARGGYDADSFDGSLNYLATL